MGRIVLPAELPEKIASGATYAELLSLKASAQADIATAHASSEKAGFTKGFNEGRAEALKRVERAVSAFEASLAEREVLLVDVVLQAVRQIVDETPDSFRVGLLIKRALQDYVLLSDVTIKAPPEDLADVNEAISELVAKEENSVRFTVTSDALLQPGEIQLLTPRGSMHIGSDRQLGRLEAALHQLTTKQS
ncbi:MAG: FliH/SctL family protein [Beijerinckiaceae bacterium]